MINRFLAKPTDVNWGGKVHGGTAMEWIDEAGAACTMEWSGEHTVAVYAGGIRFYRPISIGDLIEVDARMMRTDARSMQMSIHVRSGNPRGGRQNLRPPSTPRYPTWRWTRTGSRLQHASSRRRRPKTRRCGSTPAFCVTCADNTPRSRSWWHRSTST